MSDPLEALIGKVIRQPAWAIVCAKENDWVCSGVFNVEDRHCDCGFSETPGPAQPGREPGGRTGDGDAEPGAPRSASQAARANATTEMEVSPSPSPVPTPAVTDYTHLECRCGWRGYARELLHDKWTPPPNGVCPNCQSQFRWKPIYPEASGTARKAPSQSSDTVSASQSPTSAGELRACPWCNGPVHSETDNHPAYPGLVHCPNGLCPVRPEARGETEAEAIAAWNTRARTPAAADGAGGDAPLLRVVLESLSAELQRWYLSDQAEPGRTERLSLATAILFKRAGMEDFDGNFGFDWESDEIRAAALIRLRSGTESGG